MAINVSPGKSQVPDIFIFNDYYLKGKRMSQLAQEVSAGVIPEVKKVVVNVIAQRINENNALRCDCLIDGASEIWGKDTVQSVDLVNANTEDGMAAAESFIQLRPDVNVWLCMNDTIALGVLEYYDANRLDQSGIVIVGADGDTRALQAITDGKALRGTIAAGTSVKTQQYMDALNILLDTGDTEKASETALFGGVDLKVTKENAQQELAAIKWR
jgi:ABC-type sugar transport system substrate-binding protein